MNNTSDNQGELFDVVNGEDEVIGRASRREAHGNPKLMHRSIGVVIFNSNREIFLQHRSATKDVDPNKWTISCSGHLNSGDIYEQAAHRELREELGVDLEIGPVTKFIYRSETETEMVMLFKAFSNTPFKLNKQEISQGKFFTRNKLKALVKSGKIEMSKDGKMALEKINWL